MNVNNFRHDTIETYGPPPTTPTEALTHVLTAFAHTPDSDIAVMATSNIYGKGVRTGITFGDLRAIQRLLEAVTEK